MFTSPLCQYFYRSGRKRKDQSYSKLRLLLFFSLCRPSCWNFSPGGRTKRYRMLLFSLFKLRRCKLVVVVFWIQLIPRVLFLVHFQMSSSIPLSFALLLCFHRGSGIDLPSISSFWLGKLVLNFCLQLVPHFLPGTFSFLTSVSSGLVLCFLQFVSLLVLCFVFFNFCLFWSRVSFSSFLLFGPFSFLPALLIWHLVDLLNCGF